MHDNLVAVDVLTRGEPDDEIGGPDRLAENEQFPVTDHGDVSDLRGPQRNAADGLRKRQPPLPAHIQPGCHRQRLARPQQKREGYADTQSKPHSLAPASLLIARPRPDRRCRP